MRSTTYTTAGGDGDLDHVAARLTDVLQIERLVQTLAIVAIDHERCGIDGHLHREWPVCVHCSVVVVETLELQFQVRSPHKRVVDRLTQVENVIAYHQVVLKSKGLQNNTIAHWERKTHIVVSC